MKIFQTAYEKKRIKENLIRKENDTHTHVKVHVAERIHIMWHGKRE